MDTTTNYINLTNSPGTIPIVTNEIINKSHLNETLLNDNNDVNKNHFGDNNQHLVLKNKDQIELSKRIKTKPVNFIKVDIKKKFKFIKNKKILSKTFTNDVI